MSSNAVALTINNLSKEIKKIKGNDLIQESISYMKENIENSVTLENIARHINYSASHFSALFSQRTSFAPMEYYNSLKIQRACSYLQFSDLKIKEIAFRLGYYDQFHFSKAFKKEMELTVETYINNVRAEHAYGELKNSKKNLTQIAISCGFSSIRTMNRAFKKLYGKSASEMKKKLIK